MNTGPDSTVHSLPSSNDAPVTAKWPFVLGDAILVAFALALWATQPDLGTARMFLCLGAVALGAVLFAVPHVLDYLTLTRLQRLELEQARAEDFQRLGTLESDARKQARAASGAMDQITRAAAALEGLSRQLDAKFAPLTEAQKELSAVAVEWRESLSHQTSDETKSLKRETERLRQDQASKLESIVVRLATLSENLTTLAGRLEKNPSRPEIAPVSLEPPSSEPFKERNSGEGSMLAKALASNQPSDDSSAVSRIIHSRPRKARRIKSDDLPGTETAPAEFPAEPAVAVALDTTAAVAVIEAAPAAVEVATAPVESPPAEAENWDALAAGTFDTVTETRENPPEAPAAAIAELAPEQSAAAAEISPLVETPAPVAEPPPVRTDKARAKAAALRAALKEEEEAAATAAGKANLEAAEAETRATLAQTELLATQAEETTRRRKSSKAAADAPTLLARVLIGIGNKPYVRGDGPGLSADKGVPMEFVEIGQWRWTAPASAKSPITLRLFKNDEVPADGEPVVLEPGQTVEISPRFPN